MAYLQPVEREDESYELMMVSHAVGANANNYWTDIQLVQYLIGWVYDSASRGVGDWKQKMTPSELQSLPDPNTDFKALSRTAALIKRFQEDSTKQGIRLYADGRVDPALGWRSSISSTPYTIIIANDFFESAIWEGEGSDPVDYLLNDFFAPDTLKGQLIKSRSEDRIPMV
jgi:hypothetical protein